MKTPAQHLLEKAQALMDQRAEAYDKPEGERSMAQVVVAFNAITGHKLSEADGWEFMSVLKQVRLFQNRNKVHVDSVEDKVAYAALLGECVLTKGFG